MQSLAQLQEKNKPLNLETIELSQNTSLTFAIPIQLVK